jgi:signal transduction histidine kinase
MRVPWPDSRPRGFRSLVGASVARIRAQFDIDEDQARLSDVLVKLLMVGYVLLFLIGCVDAIADGRLETLALPVATTLLIAWAVWMRRRRRPRPVRLLMVSAAMATLFLVAASLAGDVKSATSASAPIMVVGAGAIALAAGGARPVRIAISIGVMVAASVVAVKTALGLPPLVVFAETASALVVIGLMYYLITFVRRAYDTDSSRYAGLVETAPVAVVEIDLSAWSPTPPGREVVVRSINPLARRILDVTGPVPVALPVETLNPVFAELLERVVRDRIGQQVVTDDSSEWALLVAWRRLSPDLSRVILSGTDITIQQRAERALAEEIESKDRFIATISHELRTPLTAAHGLLELLNAGEVDDDREELTALALSQTTDMVDIVQDLLVAARANAGGLVMKAEPVKVVALVEAVLASIPESFEVDSMGEVEVLVDPVRVRQIVRNLVTNAVRHGGERRRVVLRDEDGNGVIEVRDDGAAPPDDVQALMFEAYGHARDSDLPTESVGLGLTVARTLARLMGGDIGFCHDGRESVFRLTLPGLPPT